jgi:stage V sporulation protein B
MESVSAGILKGLDRQMSMFGYNLFDSVVRIVAVFIALPKFGIDGYLGIMIVSNCLTSSLCCRKLLQTAEVSLDLKNWVLLPTFVSMSSGILSRFLFESAGNVLLRLSLGIALQTAVFAVYYIKKESRSIRVIKRCRAH